MTSRKEKDEVGLRQPRDSKGRFAKARPIKPLPVNMKPQISKWSTEEDEEECNCSCACKCNCSSNIGKHYYNNFLDLQGMLNPKKDCKNAYNTAHTLLIASGGAIARVINKKTNKPFGFLVRIPSPTNPDIVYLRFTKFDSNIKNTYFQKLNAIVGTVINGERWLEKREKLGHYIDDIPFEYFFQKADRFMTIGNNITILEPNDDIFYVDGKKIGCCEREGYILNADMMAYIMRFEDKAKEYYKNNRKNKKFIALPFN